MLLSNRWRLLTPSLALAGLLIVSPAAAQTKTFYTTGGACAFNQIAGVVWSGTDRYMALGRLAAYLAPVYWFSPDEPLLNDAQGADIRIPEALPFQVSPDRPVVYYQFDDVLVESRYADSAYHPAKDKANSVLDLQHAYGFKLEFYAYFHTEFGLGAHKHDLEAVEFKALVLRSSDTFVRERTDARCNKETYIVYVTRVSAKAHGIVWFWNVSDTDNESRFPMHILVEEGKHGTCTDKNGDGYFTPGYDVNHHINDAWGIRDNIRSGGLVSGGYHAWMTKVRRPEQRVYPPLPRDSPGRARLARRHDYDEPYVEYEIRPLPPTKLAKYDKSLYHLLEDKEVEGWPEIRTSQTTSEVLDWLDEGSAIKSLSISAYYDGHGGLSFTFPFLIVKNLEIRVSGGFLLWRMYLKNKDLRDFGAMLLYTPSASRWVDTYFALGYEWNTVEVARGTRHRSDFVLETGLKFRVQLGHSPLKFMTVLTDFWGLRVGIKNYGFTNIDRLTYVLELGAGAF